MMKVNRNTINSDIKYLYSIIKDEIKEKGEDFILKQIGRLEAQRSRITESLREDNIDEKIKYEKLLLDVDSKINNLLARINLETKIKPRDTIQENEIKDLILFLLIKYNKNPNMEEDNIVNEIVNIRHCTLDEAENIIKHMKELGFDGCNKFKGHIFAYDLLEFAFLRKYLLPDDPFITKIHALHILEKQIEMEKMMLEKKFKEEHGSKEKWTDEIFEQYHKKQKEKSEKQAQIIGKIVVEALESLSNQEKIDEYLCYINVFFRKNDKFEFEKMLG